VTDSFDSQSPKSSRRKSRREPATIDLEAKVVDDGRPGEPSEGETERLVSEAMAETEAPLESGSAADSIAAGAEDPQSGNPLPENPQPEGPQPENPQPEHLHPESPRTEAAGFGDRGSEPPPPPEPQPSRQMPLAALLGAGVVGGLVGAGLVYGLTRQEAPTGQDDQRLAQLEQRVSALGQPSAATQGLENRLKALEEARSAFDGRLKAAETAAQQAEARAGEALNRPAPEAAAPQDEGAVKDLTDRLAALEGQMQAQAQASQQAGRSAEASQQAIESLNGRLEESDRRLAALAQQVGHGPDAATLAGIRLSLASRLGDALRRGAPYAEALSALERLSKDPGRLAPLRPYAQDGAPTAAELAKSFEPVRTAILRDDRGSGNGSWSDRLLRMADRVVTIRPVGEADGTGVPAVLARIDRALGRGNMAEAAAAWQSLPEPSRRLSEDWGRSVKAVSEAEAAVQAEANDALSALPQTQQ